MFVIATFVLPAIPPIYVLLLVLFPVIFTVEYAFDILVLPALPTIPPTFCVIVSFKIIVPFE